MTLFIIASFDLIPGVYLYISSMIILIDLILLIFFINKRENFYRKQRFLFNSHNMKFKLIIKPQLKHILYTIKKYNINIRKRGATFN